MIDLILLVAAAQVSAHPPSPPAVVRIADANASLQREADATSSALDVAIKRRLLGGGYFTMIIEEGERQSIGAQFQERLRSIGIPASVGQCQWMGLVAAGTARGNRSYGAACSVAIGSRPAEYFLICEADHGGVTLIHPDWFGSDENYVELFIRRTCL